MKAVQISDWDLEDRLSTDRRPVVVQFAKTGAKDQKVAREEFRTLAGVYPEAPFFEIDLLENPSAARRFSVTRKLFDSAPVTVIYVDGVEQTRHIGALLGAPLKRILGPGSEPEAEADDDE
jgi:hypothetical protein